MPVIVTSTATDSGKSFALWDNILLNSTISDASLPVAGPRINALDPATWNSWIALSGAVLVADRGSAVAVNSFGISAHTLASNGANIVLQYSSNGTTWTNAFTVYSPDSDEDLAFIFGTITARYWRVLVGGASANIGVIFVGSRLVFPHTPIDSYTPLHHARRYTKEFNDSIKGAMLGTRVMAAGAETTADFGFVPRAYVDGPLRGFENHYNRGGTFFYAGYPSGKPQDMGYCRADSEDAIINVEYIEGAGLANLSFGVRAYVG